MHSHPRPVALLIAELFNTRTICSVTLKLNATSVTRIGLLTTTPPRIVWSYVHTPNICDGISVRDKIVFDHDKRYACIRVFVYGGSVEPIDPVATCLYVCVALPIVLNTIGQGVPITVCLNDNRLLQYLDVRVVSAAHFCLRSERQTSTTECSVEDCF
jgi:hypothetical protein